MSVGWCYYFTLQMYTIFFSLMVYYRSDVFPFLFIFSLLYVLLGYLRSKVQTGNVKARRRVASIATRGQWIGSGRSLWCCSHFSFYHMDETPEQSLPPSSHYSYLTTRLKYKRVWRQGLNVMNRNKPPVPAVCEFVKVHFKSFSWIQIQQQQQ